MAIYKSFILSTFYYCVTLSMFCGPIVNGQKFDEVDESEHYNLFSKIGGIPMAFWQKHVFIHLRIYFVALLEIYICYYSMAPQYMEDLSAHKELIKSPTRKIPSSFEIHINYTNEGLTQSIMDSARSHVFGARMWNILTPHINRFESIDIFKHEIKLWRLQNDIAV